MFTRKSWCFVIALVFAGCGTIFPDVVKCGDKLCVGVDAPSLRSSVYYCYDTMAELDQAKASLVRQGCALGDDDRRGTVARCPMKVVP